MFASALKKKLNFSQAMQAERPDHIFLVRGQEASGESAWYYIMVDRGKREAFRAQSGVRQLTLTDYGVILFSGFGENPPEAIKLRMQEDYGFTG
ncbi:MAG: hypothetical protein K2Q01_05365 [Rickettsiales bacterium]|nr:hypothetical protein [Rickettsiales bacterium]